MLWRQPLPSVHATANTSVLPCCFLPPAGQQRRSVTELSEAKTCKEWQLYVSSWMTVITLAKQQASTRHQYLSHVLALWGPSLNTLIVATCIYIG